MTIDKRLPITTTIRHCWHQALVNWSQKPVLRNVYYWIYAVFFCGFLFFPDSWSHNLFFSLALLLPSLIIMIQLFPDFRKNRVFNLTMIYLAYLVLTNIWGDNVSLENVAAQIRYLLYVMAFITASIVIEAYYPEKNDRLLKILAWATAFTFLLNILWWYQAHAFPSVRLGDVLGRMDNRILASCIAGMACLVLVEILQFDESTNVRLAAGTAFIINTAFIMLSQSRTSLAALIPAFLVLAIPSFRRNGLILLCIGFLAAVMAFFLQDALIAALNRNSYRVDIWLAILEKAKSSLWLGQGYFCDTIDLKIDGLEMRHAHNVYLAALRDGGILGLLLLTAVVSSSAWRAWRQAQTTNQFLNLALVTFGAVAVFFDNDRLVDNPEELWIFFWYPICRVIAHDLVREGFPGHAPPLNHRPSTRL